MGLGQQCFPARLTHRHAQRELVRRGDVDQARAARNLVHHNAFGVHRYANDGGAMGAEQQARRRVAGVFHGDQAARTDQHPGNQVQRLLRAVAHHHILILTIDPAGERDVLRNGVT
ncbi:hypothetical protein D3C78_643320 [compost metagenome]